MMTIPGSEPSPFMPHLPERRASSTRSAQVAAQITRVLRERLARGLNDPRIQGMVSVLSTELTPDMASATVRVSVMPADRGRLTVSGLRSATRHLEALLRKATRLRRVPRLAFELDESLKRQEAVLDAIQRANEGLASTDTGSADADNSNGTEHS